MPNDFGLPKEGEWEERHYSSVSHYASIVGEDVYIHGLNIKVTPGIFYRMAILDEGEGTHHELSFTLQHEWDDPIDLEKAKKFGEYAAHLIRLLRAADSGDAWSIAKLDQIVAEEPPYVEENRKHQAEHQAWLAEIRAEAAQKAATLEPDE